MSAYLVACRYALLAVAKNRLAAVLLIVFIPLWITVAKTLTTPKTFPFRLRATGTWLRAGGDEITMISGSLNAVSLLVGFLMFSAARRTRAFDRRLTAAGYSRTALVGSKLTTLLVASVLVSAYATAWMLLFWSPLQPFLLGLAVLADCLVYGAMGMCLALFLPGEVEGLVTIIMVSIIDLAPQNPVASTTADKALVELLPSYGSLQTSLAAGFTRQVTLSPLLTHSVVWLAVMTVTALAAFVLRTRTHQPSGRPHDGT
ncbi:hypothetical protein ABT269_33985 [Streptomyces viridosporus]|uniref:Integral membrane protein n=1 Tax=Streptomyces viridosporus (strain ATCC 14672 / DSM 40746 / JCM 4963 / KCTC 9882 / NRRL B-12104 / FH 1290) TaxID=566461 RepID=D5ZX20_STRV1|nr:hypothetical protein [Streptomyces viridosporus]EFE65130.1 integral membrane protein [Streptomyces viridosporus ATCC 14672]